MDIPTIGTDPITADAPREGKGDLWKGNGIEEPHPAAGIAIVEVYVKLPDNKGMSTALVVADASLRKKSEYRFNCLAHAMETADRDTGIGFIPTAECCWRMVNCPSLFRVIRPITKTITRDGGEPIKKGDIIILWKDKQVESQDEKGQHACVFNKDPVYNGDGTLNNDERQILTKNGPEIEKVCSMADIHAEYKQDLIGRPIALGQRRMGVYRRVIGEFPHPPQ